MVTAAKVVVTTTIVQTATLGGDLSGLIRPERKTVGFSRSYGWDETIHPDGEVNVELDKKGNVVAVWFRCQPLAFTQTIADKARAEDMRRMYENGSVPKITAVALED